MIKKFLRALLINDLTRKIWRFFSVRLSRTLTEQILSEFLKTNQTRVLFYRLLKKLCNSEDRWVLSYSDLLFSELYANFLHPKEAIFQLHKDLLYLLSPPKKNIQTEKKILDPSKPLKILYVCGMFPSVEHAGGLRLFDILEILTKKHEVDIYSCFNPDLDTYSFEIIKEKFPFQSLRIVRGYEIDVDDICKWIESRKRYYDIIQLEYPNASFLAKDLKKFCKKIGFTFQESISRKEYIELNRNLKLEKYYLLKKNLIDFINFLKQEGVTLELCDFTIALSEDDFIFLSKISNSKNIFIVKTAVSNYAIFSRIERTSNNTNSNENLVSFLGFFDHTPNIAAMEWYLNKVHPILREKYPSYVLQIIGRGDTSKLREIVKNDPLVHFTGRVEDIVEYLEKSYICISPLVNGAGIRGKINQYSALKKPTVSTSIGLSGTPYKHMESVLMSDSPEGFADCILLLLTNKELYKKISENAFQVAKEHFSWDKQIKKLEEIYYS